MDIKNNQYEAFHSLATTLCTHYLEALQEANIAKMERLFAEHATVVSPLYGACSHTDFYRRLFASTKKSITRLESVFIAPDNDQCAMLFHYDWLLATGKHWVFDLRGCLRRVHCGVPLYPSTDRLRHRQCKSCRLMDCQVSRDGALLVASTFHPMPPHATVG